MPFAATCMDLEITIPDEVSHTKMNVLSLIYEIQKKKKNDTNELTYKTETSSQT